jgi:molecular chaperone DnaJ
VSRSYYEVLGIPRDANDADIKKAYRRLAMENHPDRNNGDKAAEERFKEITEAYDVLRDPEKRSVYDRYGAGGLKGAGAGPAGFHPFDLSEALSVFMRDFGAMGGLESLFGVAGRQGPARRRGPDVQVTLSVSLDEVATGANRKVKLKTLDRCPHCQGTGGKEGQKPSPCRTCGGAGEVRRATQSFFGQFISVTACPTCGGEGTVVKDPCDHCRGDGRVRAERVVDIEIPAGVSSDNYLTLRGQGAAGARNSTAGDLIIAIQVEEDQRFERRGDDLLYDLPITFSQAALGADLSVPSPSGNVTVRVPPGVQSGTVLTVRGKGLPSLAHGGRGSLHVRIQVWTPHRLSAEQKELFDRLAQVESQPQGDTVGRRFWRRIRDALGA